MFKIFYDFDDQDNIEKNLLAEASNRLEVGEFQLFQLSYAEWHGREIEAKQLESLFFRYLTEDEVPHWARHYARKIITLYDDGGLDYRAPHFHRFDPDGLRGNPPKRGVLKVFAVLAVVTAFLVGSIVVLNGTRTQTFPCNFPPCSDVRVMR